MQNVRRIVRRYSRNDDVACIVPTKRAQIFAPSDDLTDAFACASMAVESAVMAWMEFALSAEAVGQAPGPDDRGRLATSAAGAWLQTYKTDSRVDVDPMHVPEHSLLVDETIEHVEANMLRVKLVAYKFSPNLQQDKGINYQLVPEDEIDLLTSMVGTMTVTVGVGSDSKAVLDVSVDGLFAEDPATAEAVSKMSNL